MEALTRQEVRAIDRAAIERAGVPSVVLMENAGRNAADAIQTHLGTCAGRRVGILAGAGNNGGDGFVIARHLANRGAAVVTFLLAKAAPVTKVEKNSGDAKINLDILRNLRHDLREVAPSDLAAALGEFDLLIDALGGTGIRGELRGDLAEAVEILNASGKSIIAIDIPTGLDCDTGQAAGPTVRAEKTITFVARKKGFENPASLQYTGEVLVADIGIDPGEIKNCAGTE